MECLNRRELGGRLLKSRRGSEATGVEERRGILHLATFSSQFLLIIKFTE